MAKGFNQKISVLVVEDQPLAQKYLRYSLQNLGFGQVDLAEQAHDAITRCSEGKYQLILCSWLPTL
jgi:CheY-like chemotaxis protein